MMLINIPQYLIDNMRKFGMMDTVIQNVIVSHIIDHGNLSECFSRPKGRIDFGGIVVNSTIGISNGYVTWTRENGQITTNIEMDWTIKGN